MSTHKTASDIFHALVKRVKRNEKFSDVRFIKASGNHTAEKPIAGYLAVCRVVELSRQECFLYESKRGISTGKYTLVGELLAVGEKRSSMSSLQSLCDDLAEAFAVEDREGYVVSVKAGDGYFYKDMDAICQRLVVNMEFYAVKGEEESL